MKLRRFLPFVFPLIFFVLFVRPWWQNGLLPIPADTIVGLYHPWRDLYAQQYPSGIPYKNYLITDPVRQQIPWRMLAIEQLKRGKLPGWNPYSFAGTPLLGNLQAAALYPLNFLYWLLPFVQAWSWQIMAQLILGGIFMYFYLNHFRLRNEAITLGILSWIGSGFFLAWLEWNTLVQVAIWLPLICLTIDKIFELGKLNKKILVWLAILVLALSSSFLAGHIQIFFYVFTFNTIYIFAKVWQTRKVNLMPVFVLAIILFFVLTNLQWRPLLRSYDDSRRTLAVNSDQESGWFLPWQNLAQFVAPDFFGNPATLNYFGVWNYGEFVGYIGLAGLLFSFLAFFFRRDKKTFFFSGATILALIFALPTPLAKIPLIIFYAQPTRLLVLADFCLAVLAALGLDYYLKTESRKWFFPFCFGALILGVLWAMAAWLHLTVSLRNLYLPTALFISLFGLLSLPVLFGKKLKIFVTLLILIVVIFDLSRFFSKFESFSSPSYLFPQTKIINFLQYQSLTSPPFRIATVDDRAMPPNFSDYYHLQSIDGYDSLIQRYYSNLLAKLNDNKFIYNRIQTPKIYDNRIFDLLNVRYIISLNSINSVKYNLILQEGESKIYENKNYFPRTFFVEESLAGPYVMRSHEMFYSPTADWTKVALVSYSDLPETATWSVGSAEIVKYNPDEVVTETDNSGDGFLVLTDVFAPGWKVDIDGKSANLYLTDEAFRGTIVPKGQHTVRYFYQP